HGLREDHHALALELPRHRARLGERTAELREGGAHVAAGAVAVVGERLDVDGDTRGRVALVVGRLVADALHLTRAALDGALDGVEGNGGVTGLLEDGA